MSHGCPYHPGELRAVEVSRYHWQVVRADGELVRACRGEHAAYDARTYAKLPEVIDAMARLAQGGGVADVDQALADLVRLRVEITGEGAAELIERAR